MRGLLAVILTATASGALAQETGVLPPLITTYSIAVVVKEKCCDWQGEHVPVPDSADREALEKLRDRAYRNGIVLQLRLDGDRSLKIVDNTIVGESCEGYDGCRKHRLIGYWPKQHQYVVDADLLGRPGHLPGFRSGRPALARRIATPSLAFRRVRDRRGQQHRLSERRLGTDRPSQGPTDGDSSAEPVLLSVDKASAMVTAGSPLAR